MRKTFSLFVSACAVLLSLTSAQAGPNFIYNWSPPGGDSALFSDHGNYQLNIGAEGNVAAGGSTDAIAAELSLQKITGGTDAFTAKNLKLGITIEDGAAKSSPLFFNVTFTTAVTENTTVTNPGDVHISPVTSNTVVVNGDTYTITPTTFAFPGPVDSGKDGSIQFHIDEKAGGTQPPPPPPPTSDSPEPSTILLAGIGSALAGFLRWKKRRA